jgi:hypothetical protein
MPINNSEFKSHTGKSHNTYEHLSSTHQHDLWTPEETAKYLRLELSTLAKWRCQRSRLDLAWVKIGSRCFYKRTAIQSFVLKNTFGSEVQTISVI